MRGMIEGFLAFQNGDPNAMTAVVAVLDPEIEWHGTVRGLDEGQVAHGYEEVAQAFAENFEAWETLVLEAERYIDSGDDVVVLWHEVARSRHSEQALETNTAVIYTVRNGKVVEARGYMDRAEAPRSRGAVGAGCSRRLLLTLAAESG